MNTKELTKNHIKEWLSDWLWRFYRHYDKTADDKERVMEYLNAYETIESLVKKANDK